MQKLTSAVIPDTLNNKEVITMTNRTENGKPENRLNLNDVVQKNLAKARAEYLISLARALNCDPASLI